MADTIAEPEAIPQAPRKSVKPALRLKVRKAYIQGEGSIAVLSEKYGVSRYTAQMWSDAEHWTKLRSAWITARAAKDAAPDAPEQQPTQDQDEAPTEYLKARLRRVREQLDRVDEMMLTEIDPQKLDRLASAQMRLAEQERILAGRPLPGSLKPSTARRPRSQPGFSPIEPDQPQ